MSEVKCIATRDSYGNALKELAAQGADKLVVLEYYGTCSVCFFIRYVCRRQSL